MTAAFAVAKRVRAESIDIVRGVVMILMALDHVRDYFGRAGIDPTDPANTTVPLFFTRWITHFCAPIFFLLTGTGAYLSLRRKSKGELSRFLFTRGLWLIFLELLILRCLGWQFNLDYRVTMLFILWALGWSMITLAALVKLPARVVLAFGIVMIATHNLLDAVQARAFGPLAPLWPVLHAPGLVTTNPRHVVFVAYPLIPWIGVTAAENGLGQLLCWAPERRRTWLLRLGLGLTAAFIFLRALNRYGDPLPWTEQRSRVFTALSILNTSMYPSSLLFLLMTLGSAILCLWFVEGRDLRVLRPALVVGKVPMFYFLLHVPLIHLLAVAVCYARYGDTHWMFESTRLDQFPITRPPEWGFPLPVCLSHLGVRRDRVLSAVSLVRGY